MATTLVVSARRSVPSAAITTDREAAWSDLHYASPSAGSSDRPTYLEGRGTWGMSRDASDRIERLLGVG